MGDRSTFLFAVPSLAEGIGRLVDFGDTLTEYNGSDSSEVADARAMRADWAAVGDDLRAALRELQRENSGR